MDLFKTFQRKKANGEKLDPLDLTRDDIIRLVVVEEHTDKELGPLFGLSAQAFYILRAHHDVLLPEVAADVAARLLLDYAAIPPEGKEEVEAVIQKWKAKTKR